MLVLYLENCEKLCQHIHRCENSYQLLINFSLGFEIKINYPENVRVASLFGKCKRLRKSDSSFPSVRSHDPTHLPLDDIH